MLTSAKLGEDVCFLFITVIIEVLVSDNWHKGSDIPSLRSLVVDEESRGCGPCCMLRYYFYTVGLVTERVSGP